MYGSSVNEEVIFFYTLYVEPPIIGISPPTLYVIVPRHSKDLRPTFLHFLKT